MLFSIHGIQQRMGDIGGGGGGVAATWGGGGGRSSSTSKNRPSDHKYKSPKQFLSIPYLETSELKGSKSTRGATYLSHFWGRKVIWDRQKMIKRKIALKKTDSTNVIATNFVWEQLNIIRIQKPPNLI